MENEEMDDMNLHACAHLYACDRNSLFLGQRAHGFESILSEAGSLSITVVFHGPPQRLNMIDKGTGKRKMFVQESWASNSGADRLCHNSRLWDYDEGRIIATTLQDGMMRFPTNAAPRIYDGETSRKESKL
jgi:acyl-CoA thioesterase